MSRMSPAFVLWAACSAEVVDLNDACTRDAGFTGGLAAIGLLMGQRLDADSSSGNRSLRASDSDEWGDGTWRRRWVE